MTKTICVFILFTGLAAAVPAGAQTRVPTQSKNMVSVNVGAQLQEHPFTTANAFTLFDETASFSSSQKVDQGVLFDISGARTFWKKLGVSVGVSTFNKSSSAAVVATIPNPIFFNQPKVTTTSVDNLVHSEIAVNLALVWTMPIGNKMEVAFFGGPSFIHLKQGLVQGVTSDTSQNATAVVVDQTGTAKGGNAGADFRYNLTKRYAGGIFVRWAGGTAHLESLSNQKVGGGQAGIGLRVRF